MRELSNVFVEDLRKTTNLCEILLFSVIVLSESIATTTVTVYKTVPPTDNTIQKLRTLCIFIEGVMSALNHKWNAGIYVRSISSGFIFNQTFTSKDNGYLMKWYWGPHRSVKKFNVWSGKKVLTLLFRWYFSMISGCRVS